MSTFVLGMLCYVVFLGAAIERPDRERFWLTCVYATVGVCTMFAVLGVPL